MRQLLNPTVSDWRKIEAVALGVFSLVCLFYLLMSMVPITWGVSRVPEFVLQTHLFPYTREETLGGWQQVLLDYYTMGAYDVAQFLLLPIEWVYLQLVLLALLLSCWMALSTYLGRLWFWIAQGVLACLCYSLSLDQLQLMGRVDQLPSAVVLIPAVVVAWRIQRQGAHLMLSRRILVFSAYFVLLALGVHYFSVDETPFLTLAHHTYYVQLCITVLFCFMVGHELPYLMLRLSSGAGFGASAPQFIFVFLLYLAHLVLFFLKNTGRISWDIYYVDEFMFLTISAWVGIWGLRARAHQFDYLLPYPLLSINYFLMGILSFSTITYMRWSGNDPAVEVFEDMILFGHLGFGSGFFVYVLMNFWRPLMMSVPVWKRVYDLVDTPFLVVRLFGLVGVFVCYALSNKAAYSHARSGEQMHLGALHIFRSKLVSSEERHVAKTYFEQAAAYGYQSRGPNYALAQMAESANNPYEAAHYYSTSVSKHPSPEGYLNLGNMLYTLQLPEQAVRVWHKGLHHFPSDPYLSNNLSFHYLQQGRWDSVSYYVAEAPRQTRVNLWAMRAQQSELIDADTEDIETLVQEDALGGHFGLSINYLAVALRRGEEVHLTLDTTAYASEYGLPYAHNYLLSCLRSAPQCLLDRIDSLGDLHQYPLLAHDVQRLRAFAYQALTQTDRALRILDPLSTPGSQYEGFYTYVSGLWAYGAGGYSRAVDYFLRAYPRGYEEGLALGLFCTAFLPEGPLKRRQIQAWQSVGADSTQLWQSYIVSAPFADLDDAQDLAPFEKLWKTSTSSDELVGLMMQRLLDEGEIDLARQLWTKYPMPLGTDQLSYAHLLRAELDLAEQRLARTPRYDTLAVAWREMPDVLPHRAYLSYLQQPDAVSAARLAEVAEAYPFQQYLLCAAAEALDDDGYELMAYDVLLSAIETNPHASSPHKAYTLQALNLGQYRYAEAALLDLGALLSADDYADFLSTYKAAKADQNAQEDNW